MVTVLLAVVGVFAMNMDMSEQQPPSTSWDTPEEEDSVIIEHDGGEFANAEQLLTVVETGSAEERFTFTGSSYTDSDDLTASDSLAINFGSYSGSAPKVGATSYSLTNVKEVQLIWESATSTQTQLLTT